jgi:hypothetical protein
MKHLLLAVTVLGLAGTIGTASAARYRDRRTNMTWKRHFVGIGACALILLGISTNASATIAGSGCVIASATSIAGQTAPLNEAAFAAGCAGQPSFTFNPATDNIALNNPSGGTNTAAGTLATGGIGCSGAGCTIANASSGPAGTTPNSSIWYDFRYTLGTAVSQSLTITHDDGIALTVGGVLETLAAAAAPTTATATTFTMTGAIGQTVDLFYDECCALPAVLTANLPGEQAVPAPAIGHGLLVLLAVGGVLFGGKLLEGVKTRHSHAA